MAGEGDTERLVVLLEARIRDFEKNMAKASGTADRQYGKMRRDSRSATRQMEQDMVRSTSRINQALAASSAKIGAYGKAAVGGFVGGLVAGGVAGIIGQIGQVAKSIAQIGDEAKRAGVSVEAFQEWRFVAEQNRIGIDQMTDGLKELNLRADEFISTGKGSAAEAFMRLGYGTDELAKKLKNPSQLLLEIIDRLGKFDKAAQIRISDELFGGSAGERFVELIDQGEEGIRATIDRAHELGAVMDEEVIKRAEELDRKFNAITTAVGTGLKTAIVEAATAMQEFIDKFRGWFEQYTRERNAAIAGSMVGDMANNPPPAPTGPPDPRTTPKTGRLPKAAWTPPTPPPGGFGSTPKRDKAADEAEREAQAVAKLIAQLEQELALIGETDAAKRVAVELRRANVDAASEEGQQITALVMQIEAETEALERNKAAQEARTEAISNLFDMGKNALQSIVDGSVKAEDAIKSLAIELAIAAAQAALLGTGPLAGLFGGGLFGGSAFGAGGLTPIASILGRENGGSVTAGRPYIVGEKRPELFVPGRSGTIVPRVPSGGGASETRVKVDVGVSVEQNGNLDAYVRSVSQETAQDVTRRGIEANNAAEPDRLQGMGVTVTSRRRMGGGFS